MSLTHTERRILWANAIYITIFTGLALRNLNLEFVLYAGIVIAICGWIAVKQPKVRFDTFVLGGLSLWGLLHMAGGNLRVGGDSLYGLQLIPVVLRYDQLVHAIGFGVATLVCHHLLRPYLKPDVGGRAVLLALIALMGMGVGAVNELIEFAAVVALPETGVGGYDNTMMDFVFNAIGALWAVAWINHTMSEPGEERRVTA